MRDARFPADVVCAAIVAHESGEAELLKSDTRSRVTASQPGGLAVVVKEVRKPGLHRRLADCFRGAPARRAFRSARRLLEAGIGAALPLAAVEQRRAGVPMRSLLVSLDLRPAATAAERLERSSADRGAILAALADLLLALHRQGATHGDLRTQHVHMETSGSGELRARLIDLESTHFSGRGNDSKRGNDSGRGNDDARLTDWAQLNASVPDAHASSAERRAAFDRYASVMPFSSDGETAFAEMTRRSILRQHHYRGY